VFHKMSRLIPHLGTKVCDCQGTIDGQRLAFLP
jgi:hypothetical protein